jgi:hypothetical protein
MLEVPILGGVSEPENNGWFIKSKSHWILWLYGIDGLIVERVLMGAR